MATSFSDETRGMWLGAIGIAMFSLTLPFTRIAVAELNPVLMALGRAVVAAACGATLLWWTQAPRPTRAQVKSLCIVASGVVLGFPIFTSVAMSLIPASHGAIMLGILPLATALFGALRFGERPSAGFWIAAVIGSALVIAFALEEGGGSLQWGDLAMFIAVVAASMGYAEGGRLSETMGGQQVISWALLLSMPLVLPAAAWWVIEHGIQASARAWVGFAYVSLFSMFYRFLLLVQGIGAWRDCQGRTGTTDSAFSDLTGRGCDSG